MTAACYAAAAELASGTGGGGGAVTRLAAVAAALRVLEVHPLEVMRRRLTGPLSSKIYVWKLYFTSALDALTMQVCKPAKQ